MMSRQDIETAAQIPWTSRDASAALDEYRNRTDPRASRIFRLITKICPRAKICAS